MQDIISEFLEFLSAHDLTPYNPLDIKADNKRNNYRLHSDPAGKKRGYYKLKESGGFGFGFAGDYRSDECLSWHSGSSQDSTRSDINVLREASKVEARRAQEELKKQHEEVARSVSDTILFLDEAGAGNPYLKKKGVQPYGVFESGKDLIIPISIRNKVWNAQTIKPDGAKLFEKGGLLKGGSYKIKGEDDTLFICEGFATGASVREATGCAVYVAFNALNLTQVAPAVLRDNPGKRIVVAADNDHETVVKGEPYNTGVIKAEKIKQEYGIPYILPEFEEPEGKSDFNDLHASEGIKVLKEKIESALETIEQGAPPVPPQKHDIDAGEENPYNENFEQELRKTKRGIDHTSTLNSLLIVSNDPLLRGVYRFDAFAKVVLISRCPPWCDDEHFRVRPLQDRDYIELECYLESHWGMRAGKNKCADLIENVATQNHHQFNPASDYFKALQWDGVPRLASWLKEYVSDGAQPDQYLEIVGRKFMCGLAARAMNPGCKFDTMVIFEGQQNAGKSYLSRIMGTIEGEEYFLDDFKDIENKDALMKMQGKLVVEFPEISTMRKAEVNDLKAFITRQMDEYRAPYGRHVKNSPRQCVFIGTVNPEGPYLRDVTGNRRYWPVSCRQKLDIENLKIIMPHLHAEAAHLVRAGEQLWLNDEEYQMAVDEQEKRVMSDLWLDKIEDIVSTYNSITTDELLAELNIPMDRRSPIVFSRINQCMAQLGYKSCRLRVGGKQRRGFAKEGEQYAMG